MRWKHVALLLLAGSPCVGREKSCHAEDVMLGQQLKAIASLTENYCVDCHNAADVTGGLNLEDFDTSVALSEQAWDTTTWEKIVRRLRARQMPPADASRPDESEYQQALAAMESVLDRAAQAYPQPGRTDAIRGLNRTEYRNAIRDLLAIDVNVDDLLPADQLSHGFDNVTVGELSPVLLSRYITAAEQISRTAVGGLQRSPGGVTVRLPADLTQESHVGGLPLGTRGGTLFQHQFPATGEYEIQLRLMRDRDENLEGLNEPHEIDVLIDRDLVHRFSVAPPKQKKGYERDDTLIDANLKQRFRVNGGPHQVGVTFPRKFSSLAEINRQPFDANFNRHRHPRRTPALFEVSIVGPFDPQGPGDTPSREKIFSCRPTGPDDSFACAEQILRRVVRLAYRRPATDSDLVVPMRFFQSERRLLASRGMGPWPVGLLGPGAQATLGISLPLAQQRLAADGFEAGIEAALSAMLVNPHFLLRAERDPEGLPAGTVYKISDVELASRLSFFLWSSIPDERLLELAEANRLHQPDVLRTQVLRMLADERSQSLVNNFAAQWLYLRNLDSFRPDMRLFPDFDDNLRRAFRHETELLFERMIREDLSVLDLIRTDTTFLNERLAKHYGIPHVFGSQFRPVQLAKESHRGGLLRQGSILAVTSYATRTSPTIRGNWILENILGTPAPPPPPNVPSLKEKTTSSDLTIRQRLAEHRSNPACANCHNLMDPVGFALENFDAVGRWRLFDQGQPIDASGALPDGRQIASIDDLEAGILDRPEMFVHTLTEKLLTFALGRGVELQDAPAVRQIVRSATDDDYRFSSLIVGIASSPPFQMRVTE